VTSTKKGLKKLMEKTDKRGTQNVAKITDTFKKGNENGRIKKGK
jgi:hypothetical protein